MLRKKRGLKLLLSERRERRAPMDIKIIREYYEKLYVHKFDNLNEMDQFFIRHNIPKLTQEEIHNVTRPVPIILN